MTISIIEAMRDPNLLGNFFGDDLSSWRPWMVILRAVFGIPIRGQRSRALIREVTGRDPDKLPPGGFKRALLLTGRRSGKSKIAAGIASYEGVLAGLEQRLSKGERGIIPVVCPTKHQGRIVKNYLRAIFEVPILAAEVLDEQREGFTLRNGTRIEILSNDYKSVRGYTTLCGIIDEAAFLGTDGESKVSDTELVRAIEPSLITVGGRLIAISSPWAKRGWTWECYRKHYGNDSSKMLVVNCPSKTLNPTLDQETIDQAMAEDLAAARSEFGGLFREDVANYVPRSAIEALVVKGRTTLWPTKYTRYYAFVDVSAGRADDSVLGIAHPDDRTIVLDRLLRWRPPFNPHQCIREMAAELRRWNIYHVVGDNYAASFVSESFRSMGISYERCEKNKSALYLELLPRVFAGELELLDDPVMVGQLAALERRTRSGGRDAVDHASTAGAHDDLANVVAGIAFVTPIHEMIAGPL